MPFVLVVEDDSLYRSALVRALGQAGYAVVAVGRLAEAALALDGRKPDLAVIDLHLEDGSGIDVVKAVKAKAPSCRIVVVSGYADVPITVEAMRAGAMDVRTKPASTAEVIDALAALGEPPTTRLGDLERQHTLRVLDACGGNVSAAARELGLHRRTLQRKLARFRLSE